MTWRKERWYWSIERDFWFEGTIRQEVVAEQTLSPTKIAMAAASDPRTCEP
jgi:hypothetical protein